MITGIDVEYLKHSGSDLDVVNAAKVSHDAESELEMACTGCGKVYDGSNCGEGPCGFRGRLSDRDRGLIDFLARNKHKSPFNHTWIKFRVKAPIFVARQLVKHEYLPWNEVSRRYVKDGIEFYMPEYDDWRRQMPSVKQGSGGPLDPFTARQVKARYKEAIASCKSAYEAMIRAGLCREQARMVLPQSMVTSWIWSGTIYAFAKMAELRLDSHAQAESGYVAEPILRNLREFFPVSTEALLKHGIN